MPEGALLLLGDNGAGKTSLLEALYLLATTRSFRAAQTGVCVRRGSAGFYAAGVVGSQPERRLEVAQEGASRWRRLDGKRPPIADHLAVLPTLAWSSADGDIVGGAPSARRRFLDRGLVHLRPAVLGELGRYERALAEKRALLARGGAGLEPWNELLARHGAPVARARAELAGELAAELERLWQAAALDRPAVELRYRPSPAADAADETALAAALALARGEERRRRQARVGPHRDDFELAWDGGAARQVASAGERKALGLLLLVALARRLAASGRPPLLLVDDADAELDPRRLAALVPLLVAFPQVLLSSNRPGVWPPGKQLREVRVAGGAVST